MRHLGERWRLGHRPSLDGLRGIAVLLVVLGHTLAVGYGDVPVLPAAGAVGVAVFFTLSGFLITSLLLDELEASGGLRLRAFYARRARRLLPALVAVVAACSVVGLTWRPGFVRPDSVVSTLVYIQNWWGIAHVEHRDALGHTWSLAIEEQFYLLWPMALIVLAWVGRWAVIGFALFGSVAALTLRQWLWVHGDGAGGWRIYAGSDTRADGLLIGCMLAVMMRQLLVERARPVVVCSGLAGLAVTANMVQWGYQVVAPIVVSICTAAVIFGAAQGVGLRGLEHRWLTAVGRRSYGLYLWHAPLMGIVATVGLWPVRVALFLGLTAWLTVMSWRYVEAPFLRPRPAGRIDAPHVAVVRSRPAEGSGEPEGLELTSDVVK